MLAFSPRVLEQRKLKLTKESDWHEDVDETEEISDKEMHITLLDAERILNMIQVDEKSNKKGKWHDKTASDFHKIFDKTETLKKIDGRRYQNHQSQIHGQNDFERKDK